MKPTSFRLPDDALDRLRALTLPGESQSSVILRAITALEGSPPPMSMEALAMRLDGVESRLDDLEKRSAHVAQTSDTDTGTESRSAQVAQTDSTGTADSSASVAQIDSTDTETESCSATVAHDSTSTASERARQLSASGVAQERIADALNDEGFRTARGKPFNRVSVCRLLTGEK